MVVQEATARMQQKRADLTFQVPGTHLLNVTAAFVLPLSSLMILPPRESLSSGSTK